MLLHRKGGARGRVHDGRGGVMVVMMDHDGRGRGGRRRGNLRVNDNFTAPSRLLAGVAVPVHHQQPTHRLISTQRWTISFTYS